MSLSLFAVGAMCHGGSIEGNGEGSVGGRRWSVVMADGYGTIQKMADDDDDRYQMSYLTMMGSLPIC